MTTQQLMDAARQYNSVNRGSLGYEEIRFIPSTEVLACKDVLRLRDFCAKLPGWVLFSYDEDGDHVMDENNHPWTITSPDVDGDHFLISE